MLITVSDLAEDTSMTVMSVSVSNSVLSVCRAAGGCPRGPCVFVS